MQRNVFSSAICVRSSPATECQGSLGRNLATEDGEEIQLGLDTKHVTQDAAGYNIGFGHSYWIVSIPPAG